MSDPWVVDSHVTTAAPDAHSVYSKHSAVVSRSESIQDVAVASGATRFGAELLRSAHSADAGASAPSRPIQVSTRVLSHVIEQDILKACVGRWKGSI